MFSGIRYSVRTFARAPGLSLALLFTIALGIGSNVSVHRFVAGLTAPDTPLTSMDGMVSIFGQEAHREPGPLSYRDYLALRALDCFEWIGAARVSPAAVSWPGHSATHSVASITPNLAAALTISLEEGVVISRHLWQDDFGVKVEVRGQHILVNGIDVRVAAVAPEWLEGLYGERPIDLWMPLQDDGRESRDLWIVGRLRRGVSIQQARAAYPGEILVVRYTGMTPSMADGIGRVGTLLGFAAGLVFFIACANVASFLLGRSSSRAHETSLRVALGASRGQLARGLLSDSLVISIAGGTLGVLLAVWTTQILPALLYEEDAGRLVARPDLTNILAASAACVAITILCGLLPVFATSYDRPADVLRRESAGPSNAIRKLRASLVIAQMASCCMLVISTAFLFENLHRALQTSVGHSLGQPILASVQTGDPYGGIEYFEAVERATQAVEGVSPIAWMQQLPGGRPAWRSFQIEPPQLPLHDVTLDIATISPDSIPLHALPPVAGRFFGASDQTCPAAVANEAAARALFGKETAGRSIREPTGLPIEIIGVLTLGGPPAIYYYSRLFNHVPSAHFRAPTGTKLVRAELGVNVVSPNYFAALGLPLLQGHMFPNDPRPRGCRGGVINQEAADLYFNGHAVGTAVIDDRGRRSSIIGVVHSTPLGTFEPRAEPAIYFPMVPDCPRSMTLILGAGDMHGTLLEKLHRTIESVPGRGPAPILVRTLETYLSQTALAPLRIATLIIGASATTAFALSVLGLFGALSDAARQRRRELAIRIALGAQRRHVIYQVLKDGGRLAGAGALAGTLGSLLLSRMLARIAPGNGLPAWWIWLAAPVALAAAVAIASVLPARQALLVNPVKIMGDGN